MKKTLTLEELILRGAARRAQRISWREMHAVPTCFWDIETTNLALDGGLILCGSVKPLGRKMTTIRIDESRTYKTAPWDDREVAVRLRDELEKYVVVVHHYGDRFDVPALQTRLLWHRERMLNVNLLCFVDTWWQSRHRLKLHSNRLAALTDLLNTKITKTGLNLTQWTMAQAGHRPSMEKIALHNVRDVGALEQVTRGFASFMPLKYSYLK